MARYDRIAPLPLPVRAASFPGWLVLCDLDGHERDGELARRVRLRFLALRPLRRVLAAGLDAVSAGSYERQIEGIREELGHLPARDPERLRLSQYLREIRLRSPLAMASAAADLGTVAEDVGHRHAAEEFYLTSLELAERFELPAAAAAALNRLGTLYARLGRREEAARQLAAAAARAHGSGNLGEWARATAAEALLQAGSDDGHQAVAGLRRLLQSGRELGEREVQSVASAALAELALAENDPEAALEWAWSALESAPGAATRVAALERAGAALRRLSLYRAAHHAYELALQEEPVAADRWRLRADQAGALAEAGRTDEFLATRRRLLREARVTPPPPHAAAAMHLRLVGACMIGGSTDFARDHLRDGLDAARRAGRADILADLELQLALLERASAREFEPRPSRPGERARLIADAIAARSRRD